MFEKRRHFSDRISYMMSAFGPKKRNKSLLTQEEQDAIRKIRRLTLARLVVLPVGFGMTVSTAVMVILALARLFSEDPHPFVSTLRFFVIAAMFTGIAAFVVPRIDRRILKLVQGVRGRATCIPMLSLMAGLPLFRLRHSFETELAKSLAEVDEEWWTDHSTELREVVDALLEDAQRPNWLHPADGPWLPALLEAISRCGQTEYISRVEALTKARSIIRVPTQVVKAAATALISLRLRQQRDTEAATLLRPAVGSHDLLLRPLSGQSSSSSEVLLRPHAEPNSVSSEDVTRLIRRTSTPNDDEMTDETAVRIS